jgi:hypothetical protein
MTWPIQDASSTSRINNVLSSDDAIAGLKQTQKGGPNILADSSIMEVTRIGRLMSSTEI